MTKNAANLKVTIAVLVAAFVTGSMVACGSQLWLLHAPPPTGTFTAVACISVSPKGVVTYMYTPLEYAREKVFSPGCGVVQVPMSQSTSAVVVLFDPAAFLR